MGLNLNNIDQRPYVVKDNRTPVRKKQDEDAKNPALEAKQEERAANQSKSRGLQYTEQKTPVSNYYPNINPETRTQAQYNQYTTTASGAAPSYTRTATEAPASGARSASINIAQILKDFKNTAVAIGTPADLSSEINNRISLIQAEVSKENPDTGLVKSDLMNASRRLDRYISQTLNKDSKVVENWVSALFLQDIDFSYNENNINPQFLVKFPEGSTEQPKKAEAPQTISETEVTSGVEKAEQEDAAPTKVFIPQDKELKSLFLQSKRLAYANEPQKAILNFQKALKRAQEVGDRETGAKIYFEVGKIYDEHDYYAQALKSYNKSLEQTTDNNVRTKAHYSMAQIYDDVNQIKPALDHYYSSAAYGGESENLAAQSTSLTKMGNIYTDMYEQDALDYLTVADVLAAETDNAKVKGYVSSSLAKAYDKFGEPQEALKSYSKAVKHYSDANSPLKAAQSYMDAAEIMIDYGCNNKARGLLQKARNSALQASDTQLIGQIEEKLSELAA